MPTAVLDSPFGQIGVTERDWAKRTADEAFPLALPMRESLN